MATMEPNKRPERSKEINERVKKTLSLEKQLTYRKITGFAERANKEQLMELFKECLYSKLYAEETFRVVTSKKI